MGIERLEHITAVSSKKKIFSGDPLSDLLSESIHTFFHLKRESIYIICKLALFSLECLFVPLDSFYRKTPFSQFAVGVCVGVL